MRNRTRTIAACHTAAVNDLAAWPAVSFAAWRVQDSGDADPVAVEAATLADALNQAKRECRHKQVLVILETGPREAVQHTYRIKRSTTKGFYRDALDGGPRVFVPALEPELIASIKVKTFAPVEPFKWTPGCDVVGIDRQLVEQKP